MNRLIFIDYALTPSWLQLRAVWVTFWGPLIRVAPKKNKRDLKLIVKLFHRFEFFDISTRKIFRTTQVSNLLILYPS